MRRVISLLLILICFAIPANAETLQATVWLDGAPSSVNFNESYYSYQALQNDIFGTVYSFESKQAANNQMIDFATNYKVNSTEGGGYLYLSFYYKGYGKFTNYLGNEVAGSSCMIYPQFRFSHALQDVYMNGSKAFKTDLSGSWIKKSVIMKISASTLDNATVNLRFKINLLENFKVDIAAPTLIHFPETATETQIAEYLKENGYYYNKILQSEEEYSKYGIELTGEYYNNRKTLWNAGTTGDGVVKEHTLRNWLNEMLPEIRVSRILNGNYAFVEGSCNYWNKTERAVMSAPAIKNKNGGYSIPGSIANLLFETENTDSYVDIDDIENINVFTDHRGFILLSHNPTEDVVDTSVNENGYYNSAFDISDCIGTVTWDDISPKDSDYERFRSSWFEDLTYPKNCEAEFSGFISDAILAANSYLALYADADGALSPFTDIEIPDADSTQANYIALETVYSRLRAMAIGYKIATVTNNTTVDTQRLKNAVLGGLELMHTKYYSNNAYRIDGSPRFTSFKFKLPEAVSDILLCMYDDMDETTLKKYAHEAMGRSILPTVSQGKTEWTDYTNRLWATVPYIKLAVLIKDEARINHGYRYLSQVFDDASRSSANPTGLSGFYEDGSFVFHNNFAYNLGYGKSYIASVAEFSNTTAGTVFDVSKVHGYDRMYDRIINSYLPFIYDFKNMKFVAGRENAYSNARTTVASCMLIAENAPEDKQREIASLIKNCIESGNLAKEYLTKKTRFDTFTYLAYPTITKKTTEYINSLETVENKTENSFNKIYYNMDRALHKTEKFTFALAMSSSRIQKYESSSTKPNSLTQWYTGDGMTYIHNDNTQYMSSWFESANPYYMPGTTVDSTVRSTEQTFNLPADEWGLPENDFAGGVSNGTVGVAGMELGNKWVSGLAGRKSYFMLDDEIVCMGTGITGGYGNVYTVVDNRKLDGSEDVFVNGTLFGGENTEFENPQSVWLEGNIGYVLDGNDCVIIKREEYKTGQPHFVVSINHKANPENEGYLYTLLPGASHAETQKFAQNPTFEVLSRTNSLHAILRKSDGLIMANVFEPCTLYGFEFKSPCSVLIDGDMMYISDPTMKQNEIALNYLKEIKIDVSAVKGATYTYKLPPVNVYNCDITNDGTNYIGSCNADNNTKSLQNISVYLAAYNGEKLVECAVGGSALGSCASGAELFAKLPHPEKEITHIKMYIWQSLLPLTTAKEYKGN